jgi:plasmid maintenance system killer protein
VKPQKRSTTRHNKLQTAQERQKALSNIPAADLEKIKAINGSQSIKVDEEWMILAEFALRYGWDAYLAAKNDLISLNEVITLIEAARRIEIRGTYNSAHAVLIGTLAANAKQPSSAFEKMTKDFTRKMEADE